MLANQPSPRCTPLRKLVRSGRPEAFRRRETAAGGGVGKLRLDAEHGMACAVRGGSLCKTLL